MDNYRIESLVNEKLNSAFNLLFSVMANIRKPLKQFRLGLLCLILLISYFIFCLLLFRITQDMILFYFLLNNK